MRMIIKPLLMISGLALTIATSDLYANNLPTKNQKNYSSSQKIFLQAEKALKENKFNEYRKIRAKLDHYPLASYLDFDFLSKNLTLSNRAEIDKFIKFQRDSPLANRLKYRYIDKLAKDKELSVFSDYYKDHLASSSNAKHKCLYLSHQITKGVAVNKLYSEIKKLWLVPKSQPQECDSLFKAWTADGQLTHAVAFKRFNKTAQSGSVALMNYLKRYLPTKQQYLAELWSKVRKDPGAIAKRNFFPQKDYKYQEAVIAVFAIKKLAWGDRDSAYKTWRNVQKRIVIPKELKTDAERTLFLAQATENKPGALTWAKRHINRYLSDSLVSHWKLATFLRAEDWSSVIEQYDLLSENIQKTNQWRYWYAIALENKKVFQKSAPILEQLANERDYYGYKAAVRLKQPLQLNHQDSAISSDVIKRVSAFSNVERAKELFALERYRDANREWRSLQKRLANKDEIKAAAQIAHDWGWYNQGILTIAKAKEWDDTNLRFPTAFKYDYQVMGKKVGLPAEWLMGITRQESAYGPFAVSGAGAYGLMQVLPSTAKIYSKKLGVKYGKRSDLFAPSTNIEMGSNYLKLRYDELDNNPIYASAAYNAGKHRIDQWKGFGRFPTEVWIEAIPYTETRDYIKKVMTYRAIYALKLNKKDTVFEYILNTNTGDDSIAQCAPVTSGAVC